MADPVVPAPAPQTQTMYRTDGTAVEVPTGQVASAVRGGKLKFAKDQTVNVEGLDGQIVPMSGASAAAYFKSERSYGTRAATAGELVDQEDAKKFGSAPHVAASAGLGALRGLTVGLSDAAIAEIGGEEARAYAQKSQKYNPVASAGGEVAGMLLPAVFSGGTSAEASLLAKGGRAATALPRGVMAAGEFAGASAERGLVALGAEGGGKLAGAGRVLADNFVQGTAFGAGQAVSDASLKGEPLEVQKILAHGGQGGLFGMALGGGLHGTLAVGRAGVNKVGGVIKEGAENAFTAAREKLVDKVANVIEGDAAKVGAGARAVEGEVAAGAPKMADGVAGKSDIRGQLRDFFNSAQKGDLAAMEKTLDEQALKAAAREMGIATEGRAYKEIATDIADQASMKSVSSTNAQVQKRWEKLTPDARSLVPGMIEEDLRRVLGKEKHAIITRAEGAEGGQLLQKEAGDGMERVLKRLDEAAGEDAAKLPSMSTAKQRMEQEVIEPMLAEVRVVKDGQTLWKDGGERLKIAENLRKQTEAFEGTASFRQMHKDRQFFDEGINFKPSNRVEEMKSKAFRRVRNIMDDELSRAGDVASGAGGGETALQWQGAKNKWAAAKAIRENFEAGAAQDLKNRAHGLSEQFGSAKGQALGQAFGATVGSIVPVFGTAAGGLLGGLAGNAMGSMASSYSRRTGLQHLAKMAREAGTDGFLRGGMAEVDRVADTHLGTFFGEKVIQGAAAAKNQAAELLGKVETAANEAVDKASARAADAAERSVQRTEEQVAERVTRLEERVAEAGPGQVRRALVEKLVAAKEAGQARIAAVREKAAELGERAGRVTKALPSAPAIGVEVERIQKRVAERKEEEFEKTRQRFAELAENPAGAQRATAQVRIARPDLANALDMKIGAIAQYVASRAPAPTQLPGMLPAVARGAYEQVPPSEQARFLSIARTAQNPLTVLEDLEKGTLTGEQVQVLRDLYPDLHAELVSRVMDKLAEREEQLPYAKRLQLGILLAAPTDPSLEPDFIAETQASFAKPQPPAPMPGALGKRKPAAVGAATSKMSALETGALE